MKTRVSTTNKEMTVVNGIQVDYDLENRVFPGLLLIVRDRIEEVTRIHPWVFEYITQDILVDYLHYTFGYHINYSRDEAHCRLFVVKSKKEVKEFIKEHLILINTLYDVFNSVIPRCLDYNQFVAFVIKYSHVTIKDQ